MTSADELPPLAVAPLNLPRAAADQGDVQAFEYGLLAVARHNHPTVAWWHGYRRAEERFGSYCYVCETFIVTWSGNSGPPMPARHEIDAHKMSHRERTLRTLPPKHTERHPE